MNNIKRAFKNGKAFGAFITAGDPDIKKTEEYILTMVENGADLIEIGIPFSDPVAEGKIIEEANERALSMGTTTDKVFELVKKIRAKVDVPLILLTYMNPIYVYGTLKFFEKCKECGVEGLIIPDLPYEEKHEVEIAKNKFDISVVTIIAPTSRDRIKMLAENAEGLIYLIPSTDSTGVREHINADLEGIVKEIRQASEVPIVIGLGISTPEQVKNLSKISDGIVTESDIVKIVRKHGENAKELIHDYVKDMKANLV